MPQRIVPMRKLTEGEKTAILIAATVVYTSNPIEGPAIETAFSLFDKVEKQIVAWEEANWQKEVKAQDHRERGY